MHLEIMHCKGDTKVVLRHYKGNSEATMQRYIINAYVLPEHPNAFGKHALQRRYGGDTAAL